MFFGDGVTSIGGGAMYGCSRLSHVVFGAGVTSIGSGVFGDISSTTSLVVVFNGTLDSAFTLDNSFDWKKDGVSVTQIASGVAGQGIYVGTKS